MLGGGDNDGMPLKEATNRGNVASGGGNSAPLLPPNWCWGLYKLRPPGRNWRLAKVESKVYYCRV